METDNPTTNPRPTGNSSLPAITLTVLVGLIAALLYVGYDYITDDTNGSDELTNVALDTASQQPLAQGDPEMLMAPQEVDTSSQPAPVDLSQATPPRRCARCRYESRGCCRSQPRNDQWKAIGCREARHETYC